MPTDYEAEVSDYHNAVRTQLEANGIDLCQNMGREVRGLLHWLSYLRKSEATTVADALLDGVQGAIIEVTGCLTLGLARVALCSLRLQIDLALGWLYFKDHPIEWETLRATGKGFLSKSEIGTYLTQNYPTYKTRYTLLEQAKRRRVSEPYRLLSVHVHGQTDLTTPAVGPLKRLVYDRRQCEECITLQRDVAEYIGDTLLAVFADKWASIPDPCRQPFTERLSDAQLGAFVRP